MDEQAAAVAVDRRRDETLPARLRKPRLTFTPVRVHTWIVAVGINCGDSEKVLEHHQLPSSSVGIRAGMVPWSASRASTRGERDD